MPPDLPDLIRSAVIGLVVGLLFSGGIFALRWFRGQPLRPHGPQTTPELSTRGWLFGIAFFAAMAILSLLLSHYSFAVAFAVIACVYVGGFIYVLRARRQKV